MQLPIYLYGQQSLRKATTDISADYPNLNDLIANMYETMTKADGVGLAAPQVGLSIRLFVIDLSALSEDDEQYKGYKKTFINPEIIEFSENTCSYEEGCLSLPDIHENVIRSSEIKIRYWDEQFVEHVEIFNEFAARVIQHEYDHLEGKVFTDRIASIRRQLLKSKLTNILKGKSRPSYKVKSL
ncbi:MAG TPA: peptide deformylase [Bacteroidales bacterium]|nr:peptide deformylase [Bacteroidales bacterium]